MEDELNKAAEVLRNGGTILYPTDTIWGIGCDATNAQAVEKVFRIKERKGALSMLVLVSDDKMLNRYVHEVPAIAWDLMEASDRPLTIVYDDVRGLAPGAIAEDGSAGVRIAGDEFCKKLIRKLNKPIVSTSANISGQPAAPSFDDIGDVIKKRVDHVVNWRQEENMGNMPSSIIRVKNNGEISIIRK